MQYAVIETGSKQYIVQKGTILAIEKLTVAEGETISFDRVPLFVDDAVMKIGKPYCEVTVEAKVLNHSRADKVKGMHYIGSSYRRRFGHRQPQTEIEILNFVEGKAEKK